MPFNKKISSDTGKDYFNNRNVYFMGVYLCACCNDFNFTISSTWLHGYVRSNTRYTRQIPNNNKTPEKTQSFHMVMINKSVSHFIEFSVLNVTG